MSTVPNRTPDVDRLFQLTDLTSNSNKYWKVEYWSSEMIARTHWGRVAADGHFAQNEVFTGWDTRRLDSKIREKNKKGYAEVERHAVSPVVVSAPTDPAIPAITLDAKVVDFVDLIYNTSGNNINQRLSTTVDALALSQIRKGRQFLIEAQNAWQANNKSELIHAVQSYFTAIPTKLPRTINVDEVVSRFVRQFEPNGVKLYGAENIDYEEERLDQLEAAIATYVAPTITHPSLDRYTKLGAEISLISESDQLYAELEKVLRTRNSTYAVAKAKIRAMYRIKIESERNAFEQCSVPFDKEKQTFFHGTRTHNALHILRSGLIVPKVAANGRRFGDGVYFAYDPEKSYRYTDANSYSGYSKPAALLFVSQVKTGKMFKSDGTGSNWKSAPNGYDSVWGTGSWGLFDEYIVYREHQASIQAAIVLE